MGWFAPINAYCERIGPGYWDEPVNAVTNAAFLIAAFVMWLRVRGQGLPLAMAMVVVLAVIGVGSYLFHTHANRLTALMDTTPIALFILLYVFAATRDYIGLPWWGAALVTLGFIPYSMALTPVFRSLPFFEVSAFYWPVPLLIAIYAAILWRSAPATARGLALGAAILAASLTFRSIDQILCDVFPLGTHFMWHVLNGLMLGWMIEVYRRHMLAG
ncbi:MAG: ceramidase domain-containing protein [Gemmobacter sp.]